MSERITADELLKLITKDDIISLMEDLGNDDYIIDENEDLKFKTICHGGHSHKLYYYHEPNKTNYDDTIGRRFHCYTNCGSMSVYDFLMQVYDWEFIQAFNFLLKFKGLYNQVTHKDTGWDNKGSKCKDWDFLDKYKKLTQIKERIKEPPPILPIFNKTDMNRFDKIYPESWLNDFITEEAMWRFDIRFYTRQWKAVIPHYDMNGELIGIRGRSFLKMDLDDGKKYMPIYYGNLSYKHPLQFNLYGLYQNKEIIKKVRKAILFESEKSVMQCESFYPNNNFSLSLCGTNMSNYQRDTLLSLGVDEVFIALDKQFKTELLTEEDNKEYNQYVTKVKKIADKLVNYVNVYIIYCDDGRLDYKEAPSDKGRGLLEELMKEKHKYHTVLDK